MTALIVYKKREIDLFDNLIHFLEVVKHRIRCTIWFWITYGALRPPDQWWNGWI